MSLGLFDEVSAPSRTHVRLSVRRHCTGCNKLLFGAGFKKCMDCREAEADAARVGRRLCCECGEPAKRRSIRCAPCWDDNNLEVQRRATVRYRTRLAERVTEQRRTWKRKSRPAHTRNIEKAKAHRRAYLARQKAKREAQDA